MSCLVLLSHLKKWKLSLPLGQSNYVLGLNPFLHQPPKKPRKHLNGRNSVNFQWIFTIPSTAYSDSDQIWWYSQVLGWNSYWCAHTVLYRAMVRGRASVGTLYHTSVLRSEDKCQYKYKEKIASVVWFSLIVIDEHKGVLISGIAKIKRNCWMINHPWHYKKDKAKIGKF